MPRSVSPFIAAVRKSLAFFYSFFHCKSLPSVKFAFHAAEKIKDLAAFCAKR